MSSTTGAKSGPLGYISHHSVWVEDQVAFTGLCMWDKQQSPSEKLTREPGASWNNHQSPGTTDRGDPKWMAGPNQVAESNWCNIRLRSRRALISSLRSIHEGSNPEALHMPPAGLCDFCISAYIEAVLLFKGRSWQAF